MLSLRNRALIARCRRALDALQAEVSAAIGSQAKASATMPVMGRQYGRQQYGRMMTDRFMSLAERVRMGPAACQGLSPQYQAAIQQWMATKDKPRGSL